MTRIFINFTNHPSQFWGEEQKKAALMEHDLIIDLPFPPVDPKDSSAEVEKLAENYVERLLNYSPVTVLCQGEFSLCYHVITALKAAGITVVSACSERITLMEGNIKKSMFIFKKFRRY